MKSRRKHLLILLSLVLTLSLVSCKDEKNQDSIESESNTTQSQDDNNEKATTENDKTENIDKEDSKDIEKEDNQNNIENENLVKREDLEKNVENKKYKVSPLFDDIYYELIKDKSINEEKLLEFIDQVNYNVEKMDGMPGAVEYIFTSERYPDEYFYIEFSSEDNSPYNILHYENVSLEKAVSWMNLSDERSDEFDKYQVYEGDLFFEVNNLDDQIKFLNK